MTTDLSQRLELNRRIAEYMKRCEYNETLECFKREAALPEAINVEVEHESKEGHEVLTGEKKRQIRHVPWFLLAISLLQFLLQVYTEISGNNVLESYFIKDSNK